MVCLDEKELLTVLCIRTSDKRKFVRIRILGYNKVESLSREREGHPWAD